MRSRFRRTAAAAAAPAAVLVAVFAVPGASAGRSAGVRSAAAPRVLLVGTWHGRQGRYKTIQGAVRAANPGDWILVGPGDYHERADHRLAGRPASDESGGGVYITKSRVHLRGVNRNRVFVDGAKRGTGRCSGKDAAQDFGPSAAPGKKPLGRNGVEVYKANGVSVENLSACNFLDGSGGGGNQIWFNGGDGSGKIGMGKFRGSYLSATTTFFKDGAPAASYGIFSSNSRGPGLFSNSYASNMDDSSFYVGACRPDCNQIVDHVHAQGSTLGLSSTNVGGRLLIKNSEWDHNKTGMVTNSQNNDDAPEPQDGRCPPSKGPPSGGAQAPGALGSCTIWTGNFVHDNNNPNVPASGTAGEGPVGTGMVISGGRYDTIRSNRVEDNGSWGILLIPFPDVGPPPSVAHCRGGVSAPNGSCYFDDWGNEVASNKLNGNGFFGNPTNGDLAEISNPENPGNCWHGNTDPAGVTSEPAAIQTTHGSCGIPNSGDPLTSQLGVEVACATGFAQGLAAGFPACPAGPTGYPQKSKVKLLPLPKEQSMPNPCSGVPDNPWCSHGKARPAKKPKSETSDGP